MINASRWRGAESAHLAGGCRYHRHPPRLPVACFFSALLSLSLALAAFGQATPGALATGLVLDSSTGQGVDGALIELHGDRRATGVSDLAGAFRIGPLYPGTYTMRITRLGYQPRDTTVVLAAGETDISISLELQPIPLRPLTVRTTHIDGGAAAERELFEREVVPGAVGISRREIREIPVVAEPDLLRALQALPGVVALNDLSAELHVRGGGPDQNLLLLDGARIFAPYHMFGIFGAFNVNAVGRTEFFRGALPARYGGALSSVIAVEQRADESGGFAADGGLSLLGARLTLRGESKRAEAKWLLAARRSHADLIYQQATGDTFPYAFHDLQGRVSFTPSEGHRLIASFFVSDDRYRNSMMGSGADLGSAWSNAAGSLRWRWVGRGRWSASSTAWASRYDGSLTVGREPDPSLTRSAVDIFGLRFEAVHRGESSGLRFGLDLESGGIDLIGSPEADGYVQGSIHGSYTLPSVYLEAERWLGRVRLAPGLRMGYEASGRRWLLEPRLAARAYLSNDLTLTAGAGRTRQVISTIRDDRFVLPGPPLWFLHPGEIPATTADGVDLTLDGWQGRRWSYSAGVYARHFEAVPRWRPEGSRELSRVAYDDGSAVGLEFMIRHHREPWTGWAAYGLARATFNDEQNNVGYHAAWDRRHAVDVAIFRQASERLSLSVRLTYGSGLPFWPTTGWMNTSRIYPTRTGGLGAIRRLSSDDTRIPIWAQEQRRLPALFRADLGARYDLRWGRLRITPYASVLNVTGRANVLYYKVTSDPMEVDSPSSVQLEPVRSLPLSIIPTFGFDVTF